MSEAFICLGGVRFREGRPGAIWRQAHGVAPSSGEIWYVQDGEVFAVVRPDESRAPAYNWAWRTSEKWGFAEDRSRAMTQAERHVEMSLFSTPMG